MKLSLFAGLGSVMNTYMYIRHDISNGTLGYMYMYSLLPSLQLVGIQYIDLVSLATEHSMCAAVEEVKTLPHYDTKGEVSTCPYQIFECMPGLPLQWVITDARHDSTANAYHTTVPCLSGR